MDPAQGGPMQGLRTYISTINRVKLGCENEVVCLDDPSSSFVQESEFIIHALGKAEGPWRRNPALRSWLRQNLARFDSVIIHGLWLYHSYAVTKAIAAMEVGATTGTRTPRVFVMPHGMLDPWFQRHPSRRMKAIRNWLYWKLVERRTIGAADGLLFTCQKELELARQTFRPYRPRRELNVGYGVAAPPPYSEGMRDTFRRHLPAIAERPFLLFLSRVHPKKGVDLLIKAYVNQAGHRARMGLKVPDLVVAGPLDSKYADLMKELARKELATLPQPGKGFFAPNIHFPGMLSGDDKWAAFYGCDAFVLPSHQENFGIAVGEALACGKPVLISDQVNICDEIKQANAGLVDKDDLAGAESLLTQFFLMDAAAIAKMGVRARQCYETNFSPETAAIRLLEAITAPRRGFGAVSVPPQSLI